MSGDLLDDSAREMEGEYLKRSRAKILLIFVVTLVALLAVTNFLICIITIPHSAEITSPRFAAGFKAAYVLGFMMLVVLRLLV